MKEFIRAEVIEKIPGAVYQDSVWDWDVIIQHASGIQLKLFDGFDRISEDLKVHQTYQLILSPLLFPNSMTLAKAATQALTEDELDKGYYYWSGEIVDTTLKLSEYNLSLSIPNLSTRENVLVKTSLGGIIFSKRELAEELGEYRDGDVIQWKFMRLDLLAVVER